MRYEPGDLRWEVLPDARAVFEEVLSQVSPEWARQSRTGLREHICAYFSTSSSCDVKGVGISPMGSGPKGKVFKVKWALPGMGKRGGLRLAILAMCPERHIVLAGAWVRRDEPSPEEIAAAVAKVYG